MLFCCLLQHHLKWLGYRFTGRRYTTILMRRWHTTKDEMGIFRGFGMASLAATNA
jgi:hypothetical protein